MKKYCGLLLLIGLWMTACKSSKHKPDQAALDSLHAQSIAGNFSNQTVLHFDSGALTSFLQRYPDFAVYTTDLQKFYRLRHFSYAWYDQRGLIEQGASLFNRSQNLQDEGLSSKLPYADAFKAMMDNADSVLHRTPMNPYAELMLTAQYFSYAHRVWQGVDETQSLHDDWFLTRKKLDLQELMDSLLHDANKSFVAHEPVYRQYGLLKSYLKKYRDIEAAGGWQPIPQEKQSYKTGDDAPPIKLIRKRLFMTGEFSGDTSMTVFTDDLTQAVKLFQRTRGWTDDGVVGRIVINEMNIPVTALIEKIVLNMERCRWVPVALTGEYLVVNIPAFKLYAYRDDSLLWDMNVVAGQPVHETVIFNGDMKYVVFSPYWNVPNDIYKNEILPGMQSDPDYLAKHNMESVNGTVRQKPGPNNSLGQVKFLFPNSYSIYLHDTPSKSLFKQDSRAFSHGCIRLAEPKKLAMYLLKDDPQWTEAKINAAMNAGQERWVTLKQTIPVFIAYFTAWVDRQGNLNVRPDIYKRDGRLAQMVLKH